MALKAGERMESGFVRDENGRLVAVAEGSETNAGFITDKDGRVVVAGSPSFSPVTTGEGAPARFGKGLLYFQLEGSKAIALWEGQGTGADAIKRVDLTGTPAEGSVGLAQLSTAAVEAVSKLNAGVWRSRHSTATTIGSAAQTGKKFWVVNGQTSNIEAAASLGQPWRVGWVAADEAVEHLTSKCKIKAVVALGAAINANVTIALYKVGYSAEKLVLGEQVVGSSLALATGALTNQLVKGESGEFAPPEDGEYAIGAEVSGATSVACGVQARLLIHNI